MVIKAENNVTKDDVKALINCNSAKLKFMLILLIVTFLAFLIFSLIIGNNLEGLYILGVVWCAVVYGYVFFINPKVTYNLFKKKYTEEAVVSYQFNEKSVEVTVESQKESLKKRKNYRDMFRIYETPQYYFLYFKRNESYIMKKSGIKQGTPAELTDMILKQEPREFIRKAK